MTQSQDSPASPGGLASGGFARTLGLQVLIAVLVAAVWAAFSGANAGTSALAGGAICIIPSAVFGWRLRSAARKGVAAFGVAFFAGEIVKLGLSAAMFAAAVAWYPDVDLAALVTAYILTLQAYLLALLVAR